MLKISDFSKLSKISIRMLRYYDENGLLKPLLIKDNGYRYYQVEQLIIANQINYLKYLGFSSDKIKVILQTFKEKKEIKSYLQMHLADLYEEKKDLDNRIEDLRKTLKRMNEEEILMNYKVESKVIEFKNMMCRRGIIPNYESEGLLWEGLCNEIEKTGMDVKKALSQVSLAVFHDEGYKEKEVNVEIMCAVEGNYVDTENIKFKPFGPMKVVSITYTGEYKHISEISSSIAKWITENNCELAGPSFTIYHVGYAHGVALEKFVTEVCYPIR